MSLNWATWERARSCTGKVTPGAQALRAYLLEEFPQSFSMGIYNCRSVAGTSTTSLHGEGRAYDNGWPTFNGKGTKSGEDLVRLLGSRGKQLGIQAVIYNRKIWSATSPNGRAYGGTHPHYDHHHIELNWNAANRLNLATLRSVLGTLVSSEENMLAKNSKGTAVKVVQTALKRWNSKALPEFGVDGDFGTETETWVKRYQKAAEIQQTGKVDGVTMGLLSRYVGIGGGLSLNETDKRYVRKGATITLP